MDPGAIEGQAGVWTTAEDLMIINAHNEETDNPVTARFLHDKMPHHSYASVSNRYYELTRRNMKPDKVSQLWHMWLL